MELAPKPPLFRAGFARLAMRRAAGLAPSLEAQMRATMGPALCRAFDEAPLLGWIPYLVDVRMAEGVLAQRGAAGLRAFVLGNTAEAAQSAAMRPVLDGALRIFGMNPGSLLRVLPELWKLSYRDVLAPRVERDGEHGVRIEGSSVCDEMLESEAAHCVISAQAEGAMAFAQTKVTVAPVVIDRARRTMSVALSWARGRG